MTDRAKGQVVTYQHTREMYSDQNYETDHDVAENPTGEINILERNIHKRVKDGDDSFEQEHRNDPAQQLRVKSGAANYFNYGAKR